MTGAIERVSDDLRCSTQIHTQTRRIPLTLRRANCGPLKAVRGRLSSLAAAVDVVLLLQEESEEFAEAVDAAPAVEEDGGEVPLGDSSSPIAADPLAVGRLSCFFGFLVRGPVVGAINNKTKVKH